MTGNFPKMKITPVGICSGRGEIIGNRTCPAAPRENRPNHKAEPAGELFSEKAHHTSACFREAGRTPHTRKRPQSGAVPAFRADGGASDGRNPLS